MAKLRENIKVARVKYNWDQWLDGQVWELVRDEDFTVQPATLRTALYNNCRQRGLRGKSTMLPNGNLLVQAIRA